MGVIIYPPTIDWSYMRQRPQQLMLMFARNAIPVCYLNQHNQTGPVVEKITENLFVIHHLFYFMETILPKLQREKTLYWTSWSRKIRHAGLFHADCTVYDCVDDFPDWEEDEKRWVGKADLIVCTAESLKQKMKRLVPEKPSYMIPNGCDWSHFSRAETIRAASLYKLPKTTGPKIGYVGAWAPWVDEELIRYAAQSLPDAQFVIVGPQLRSDTGSLGGNVFNLGYKDYQELPRILAYLDVCIIPFRINRITESTNPVKVYEYLAAGKPVVSTDLPEVRTLQPYVRIGDTPDRFVRGIRDSLGMTVDERRALSVYAKQFSWEQRFAQVRSMVARHAPKLLQTGAAAQELENWLDYVNTSIPLVHCTVNSFYGNRNLPKDPPMIGCRTYECYLKLEEFGKLDSGQVMFLEFEPSMNEVTSTDTTITVYVVCEPWERLKLTYNNKPSSGRRLASWVRSKSVNETLSVNVTGLLSSGGLPSFHIVTDDPGLIRITHPRITVVAKRS